MDFLERKTSPLYILDTQPYLRICAPMVRYSKLPFRELVKNYNVDLTYTPMIIAQSFKNSQISRDLEFTTVNHMGDSPVIVQFASNDSKTLADAAEMVAPYCSGIDINCGCPQKWAINEGIGASLMDKPDLVSDMVSQVKQRTSILDYNSPSGRGFPCSIKIRIHKEDQIERTVELCRRAEMMGVDWITVHGRTKYQKPSDPVDFDTIKVIKSIVSVPVFANGDIFSLKDAEECVEATGVDGVMSARGLLENPALFSGFDETPLECIEKFVRLSIGYGSHHFIFHHHLMYMMEKLIPKTERAGFNCLSSVAGTIDYLESNYGLDLSNLECPPIKAPL